MGLSRRQLWVALGFMKPEPNGVGMDELTDKAYDELSWEIHRGGFDDAPHGQPWHTSFHASGFPPEKRPCARKAMYELMGIPTEKPAEPWLVAVADAGKDIENQIVKRWHNAGWLLTAPPGSPVQTGFADPDSWLTCSVDAALDLRSACSYEHVLPVDVKGKDHAVVTEIRAGKRGADAGHVQQVTVQTAFCRSEHERMGWGKMGLEPAKGASLLYVSRQRPGYRAEVHVPWDEARYEKGLAVLGEWRDSFLAGALPERPKAWRWTEEPCKWCDHRDVCKFDIRKDVVKLEDSTAISKAQAVRPTYDYERARYAVLERWSNDRTKGGNN